MDFPFLSILIFLPIASSLLLALLPDLGKKTYQIIAVTVTGIGLAISAFLWFQFHSNGVLPFNAEGSFAFVERSEWFLIKWRDMGWLSAEYYVGTDGLGMAMVVLSALVLFVGSFSSFDIQEKQKAYFSLYLLLCGSIIGCFVALDFLLFFLFFEFMLLPMYFLIGIWGGKDREYAAIKFFIYTLVGSLLILVTLIGLYSATIDPAKTAELAGYKLDFDVQQAMANRLVEAQHYVHTFSIPAMSDSRNILPDSFLQPVLQKTFDQNYRLLFFVILMLGLAIKVPIVPLHTWLPDAHVQAPTPISVVLAGLLLKIGTYGMMRLGYGIFPEGAFAYGWWIGLAGVVAILYAAWVALATKQLKRLIAFSSISHMGFVLLGLASLTPEGVSGAVFQMVSHGLISPMLFLLAGVIYSRTHDLEIYHYRGLAQQMPRFTVFVTVGFFASLGLPGFSGFIAEVLVFLGSFSSESYNGILPRYMAIAALAGLVITASYYLWTLQRMFFGEFQVRNHAWKASLTDLNLRELGLLAGLTMLIVALGVQPGWLLDPINATLESFINHVNINGHLRP